MPTWGCGPTSRQESDAILKDRKRFGWNGTNSQLGGGHRPTGWSGKRVFFISSKKAEPEMNWPKRKELKQYDWTPVPFSMVKQTEKSIRFRTQSVNIC